MDTPKNIRKLNELLRAELGTAKGLYAWKWSESPEMHRPMRVIHDDGTPVFEFRKQESGLTLACPVYTIRKTALDAEEQWLLAILLPPALSLHEWEKVFGTSQAYPGNGEWAPCDPIRIPRGQQPTEFDTWTVIDAMRRQRKVSNATWDNESLAALDKRDAGRGGEILDAIKDAAPAFNNAPGMKGSVSFPSLVTP
jgi:hypothetical protein